MIDPNLLVTFVCVADAGKISTASQQLHLSQPAVTAKIRKLEEQLGVALFYRSAKGVKLTEKGSIFYQKSKYINELIQSSINEIVQTDLPETPLNIIASTTIGSHLLPVLLTQFAQQYPNIKVSLAISNTQAVIKQVRNGLIPLGLVEGLSKAAGVSLQPLLDDELLLVSSTMMKNKIKTLHDLAQYPIIWRETGSGTRRVVEKALQSQGIKLTSLNTQYEFGNTESIRLAIENNLGVGFLSKWSIVDQLDTGKLHIIKLDDFQINRSFSWVLPSGGLSGSEKLFFDFCERNKKMLL